ncbi:MAG: hypothetical protein ACU837_03390 [Gammaproteobacteria bacterium]
MKTNVKNTFTAIALATLSVPAIFPTAAQALPSNLYYMVSPPSCRPVNSSDNSKLRLVNGAWTFKTSQVGTAYLYCPINFSGDAAAIDTVVLSYRDGFTALGSDNGYVRADFMARNRSAAGTSSEFWLASTYGNGQEYGFDALTSAENSALANNPKFGRINYLQVILHRSNASKEVAFTGFEIRF